MDEMTQHNAALVEETNAAIEQTESQASELDNIVAVFTVNGSGVASPQEIARKPSRPAAGKPAGSSKPAAEAPRGIKALQQKVKSAAKTYLSPGNAAVKSDDWAEF
jgi:methyl-accepting chemotaxis protein